VIAGGPGQLADDSLQWSGVCGLVVADADYQYRRRRPDATTCVPQQVQRRLVGPVQILEHDHMRALPQLGHECCEHLEGRRAAAERLEHLAP
jgi:hypothetical protein